MNRASWLAFVSGVLLVVACAVPEKYNPADGGDTNRDMRSSVSDVTSTDGPGTSVPDTAATDGPMADLPGPATSDGGLPGADVSLPGADAEPKPPVKVGLLAPKTGVLHEIGKSFERVAITAVANINAAGGLHGRELQLIVEDTQSTSAGGVNLGTLVTQGAVAVVGPATTSEVSSAAPIAKFSKIPIISPTSTAAYLSSPTGPDDGGYMFRNVPDDNVEGVAMAYYLRRKADPAIGSVAILLGDSSYAQGVGDAFKRTFERLGGAAISRQVIFRENLPDVAAAKERIGVLAEQPAPSTVVLIASEQDAVKLLSAWYNEGNAVIPNLRWFMSNGVRLDSFLSSAPIGVRGMCGTAPIYPTESASYLALKSAYESRNPDKIDQQVAGPNVWDAIHLIAAAVSQQIAQYPSEPPGGEHLRDALTTVSRGGRVFDATQWSQLTAALRSGTDVDYDGAAGPNDFDAIGQVVAPYEVWCIATDGRRFERRLVLSAGEISNASN